MRFWWVNIGQTYRQEVSGGYMWSPKTRSDGAFNQTYQNMTLVESDDFVFAYKDQAIHALGRIQSKGYEFEKPDEFGQNDLGWANDGWKVDVEWNELSSIVSPKDFINELRPFLSEKYAPLQENGKGKQGLYLTEIRPEFFRIISEHIGEELEEFTELEGSMSSGSIQNKLREIHGNTEVDLETKQRVEQPYLRKHLFGHKKFETCAICNKQYRTKGLMVAGHIKKRSDCTDDEKVDLNIVMPVCKFGCDDLYEHGYIYVDVVGTVRQNPANYGGPAVNEFLKSLVGQKCGAWREETEQYFEFHRNVVTKV